MSHSSFMVSARSVGRRDERVKTGLGGSADTEVVRVNGAEISIRIQDRERQKADEDDVRICWRERRKRIPCQSLGASAVWNKSNKLTMKRNKVYGRPPHGCVWHVSQAGVWFDGGMWET